MIEYSASQSMLIMIKENRALQQERYAAFLIPIDTGA